MPLENVNNDKLQEWLKRPYWFERKVNKRIPVGFKRKDGDPSSIVPDPELVYLIEEALDQLDAGISLRETAETFNSKSPKSLSHTGLMNLWNAIRPDHPMKIGPKPKRVPREKKQRLKKNHKLGAEKRKIIAAQKRIEKLEQELNPEKEEPSSVIEYVYEMPEIDEEQTIIFKPNEGPQTEFLASSELEVLYGGAAGGGKSFAMLADPMRYFHNPNFNGLLLRRTNDELRELKWKSYELYTKAFPGSKWSEKNSSWTFPAGGHFWFTYLERDDDVRRYQGHQFTWVGFDELTQYSTPFAWNFLRSRLRTTDPELQKSLSMRGTTNPGGPGHGWVKQMFVDPAPPGRTFPATDIDTGQPLVFPKGHAKEGQPLFYRRFIPAKVQDNPYLWEDGTYEANLLSLPENQRRQLLEGDWAIADGAAFPEFKLSVHTCEPFEIPENWRRFRSCDWGYSQNSASAVHWYAVDPNGTLYVYRELYVNQKTGKELAGLVLEAERKNNENISYGVLDSSVWQQRGQTGPSIAEEMIHAGCRWRPSDRSQGSRVASKNRLHELLKKDEFTGKPGIIFFNNCRRIIADLQVIPVDPDGTDDIDPRYANDHAYDSIRYGIMTRPQPNGVWKVNAKSTTHYRPSDNVFGY